MLAGGKVLKTETNLPEFPIHSYLAHFALSEQHGIALALAKARARRIMLLIENIFVENTKT